MTKIERKGGMCMHAGNAHTFFCIRAAVSCIRYSVFIIVNKAIKT